MLIKEIQAKSIITKSGLPDSDYVINPYIGCMHGCIYCYAGFMKRFTNHPEPWGKFVDIKVNAVDLIPKNLDKFKGKSITISSVTDPYQPLEKKYELTRGILEKLIPIQASICIITKSDLVIRDIDLLKQFKNLTVAFSISQTNEGVRKEIEPLASPIENRIKALKELHKAGIYTVVFVSPMFPEISNWQEVIKKTKDFTDEYWFENLNVRGTNWGDIKRWLKSKHPELLPVYEEIYFTKTDYWDKVEKEIKEYCKKNKIKHHIYFHH